MISKQNQSSTSNFREQFFNNRLINRRRQINFWKLNWKSGFLRLLERVLIGTNLSDRLGGNLSQFEGFPEFHSQVLESTIVNEPKVLNAVTVQPLGSSRRLEISGISLERRIMRLGYAKVDSYSGLITTDSGLILDLALPKWQKLIYMGGMADSYSGDSSQIEIIQGRWAVLPISEYYFHTLTEDIATLLAIREVHPEFKVLIFRNAPSWALELLDLLGFEYRIINQRKIRVEELLCSTRIETFSKDDFLRFSRLKPKFEDEPMKGIFLSRGNLSRGDKNLENELMDILSGKGFEVVYPQQIPVIEQVQVFNSAERIVSFHGGALSNLVWCKKGTRILEIFNHPYRSYDFARIAAEGELRYFALDTTLQGYRAELLNDFLQA